MSTTPYRPIKKSRPHSVVRRKKPSLLVRLLQHLPSWSWWVGGLLIMAVYVWLFYYFFVGPTGFRWRALYGEPDYPEGYEIHGIDISHYQGKIDWHNLKSNGMIEKCPVRFVLMKATEGSTKLDPMFMDNFYQAREYGFIRGAYHFWSNKTSAESQARYFIQNVDLEDGDLPPVLDVEHKPKEMSTAEFQVQILNWLNIIEQEFGVKPIIYTYYKFKMNYLNEKVFDQYPYWIAHYYVDKVDYNGPWKFWQHTDCGKVAGIKGYVDFDIYNGSYYDLRKLTIGSHSQIGEEAYDR